ncbi:hypothetical protein [Ramlibacter tataouinensis]|uniref:hypothetical protein n=1 Tax=Ramlibacter tataouinensis TaxID=94132 RepID=UPI0002DA2B69|nr:hypothetical protein [Ramlibacter tataouinensis]
MGRAEVDLGRRAAAGSLALLGTLGLAACGGGVTVVIGDDDHHDDVTVSFNFVAGYDARVLPEGNHVFRSQADLNRVWAASPPFPEGGASGSTAPLFDFANFTLVAVALGVGLLCERPRLTSVRASGGTLIISYRTGRDPTLACVSEGLLQFFLSVPFWPGDILFRRLD